MNNCDKIVNALPPTCNSNLSLSLHVAEGKLYSTFLWDRYEPFGYYLQMTKILWEEHWMLINWESLFDEMLLSRVSQNAQCDACYCLCCYNITIYDVPSGTCDIRTVWLWDIYQFVIITTYSSNTLLQLLVLLF